MKNKCMKNGYAQKQEDESVKLQKISKQNHNRVEDRDIFQSKTPKILKEMAKDEVDLHEASNGAINKLTMTGSY